MLNIVAVAIGGAAGALSRYAELLISPALFLWELPQNLLGLVLLLGLKTFGRLDAIRAADNCVYLSTAGFSVSLGRFLFCQRGIVRIERHEYGHSIQSRMLGPLYLIVVGLPSIVRNLYGRLYLRITGKKWPRYYAGFPERWADRLAGLR